MPLATLENITIRFRGPALLEDVSRVIEPGHRIGLLGRNGAGKTTLLKILSGALQPDNGQVVLAPGTRIARLIQEVPADTHGHVRDVVAAGIDQVAVEDQWRVDQRVEKTLDEMQLDGESLFEHLSSGLKRRVLLAQSIVTDPHMLLLDEPTNHLDIDSILWLEDFLSRWRGTLMFITHDRSFLRKLADRIWEVEGGRLFDWTCDYDTFLKRKEEMLEAEEKQNALFDKKLAQEEAWIRQGIKARRTRNEGRVRALKELRNVRQQRRKSEGVAKLQIQDAGRSGVLVAEVKEITFSREDRQIISPFSTTIMRGDKIGIIGRNGAGKTTLLNLLLGKLQPDSGHVRMGTNLEIAYFDQLRDQLEEEKTVLENVGDGTDRVKIGDKSKHIIGYLQDFLFTAERARTQVKFLSGGERNRVLLAKLMTRPANVIVLDEPTNDLDSETLDLLESQLVEFPGTLLLVSHDRTFLNNVVTSTIVFESDGINEYVGGYDDWQAAIARRGEDRSNAAAVNPNAEKTNKSSQRSAKSGNGPAESTTSTATVASGKSSTTATAGKLSYKETRLLQQLPEKIEKLEAEIASRHQAMAEPDYYRRSSDEIAADGRQLADLEATLAQDYRRWEELEQRSG
jgi:ATP-binding cassette subfamily F protein uup